MKAQGQNKERKMKNAWHKFFTFFNKYTCIHKTFGLRMNKVI